MVRSTWRRAEPGAKGMLQTLKGAEAYASVAASPPQAPAAGKPEPTSPVWMSAP